MAQPTDEELLDRARAGDPEALTALLERHEAQVYRFSLKMCGHPEDAKDALQETLLTLARNVGDFRGASSLSTWLYAVARSFCAKKRRRSKFAPAAEQSLDTDLGVEASLLPDPGRGPDEQLVSRRAQQALSRAIGALEPIYREVLLLRDVEGLSAPEVAEVLGIGVPAVKSRLHRARLAVREQLAPLLGEREAPATADCPGNTAELLSRHLEGEIGADDCARMERHLEGCTRCRGNCEALRQSLALCRRSAEAAAVPPDIQRSVRTALRRFLAADAADGTNRR